MSAEENKALFRRFMDELANKGNLGIVDELVAPDFVEHEPLPPDAPGGREAPRWLFAMMRDAFPDLHITLDDELAEGDRVVARLTVRGTQRGEIMGIPPTGNSIAYTAIDIVRVADGKLVEHWGVSDQLSFLQQLGAIPAPGQPGA